MDEVKLGTREIQGGHPRALYVTIPAFAQKLLNIEAKGTLEVSVKDGALVYTPVKKEG